MVANEKSFRILSLDAGGLYGLFSALMLKELIKQEPMFLRKGSVDLFAGTASGAITTLILAKHEEPRDGIEEVINFWKDQRLYWNFNPLSLVGLSSWYDQQVLRLVLQEHFGALKLEDLKHQVLITAFNWAGNALCPPDRRHWKPKIYYNFPESESDRKTPVVDLATRVFGNSFLFPIMDGQQSGTWYAPNPVLCGVAKAVNFLGTAPPEYKTFILNIKDTMSIKEGTMSEELRLPVKQLLSHLSVLSVGIGNKVPFLPVNTENWGSQQWLMGMFNHHLNQWVQPLQYIYSQGPEELAKYQADNLLNWKTTDQAKNEGFHRLDTDIFKNPVWLDMWWLRNNFIYHQLLLHHIENSLYTGDTIEAIDNASDWLTKNGWFNPEQWAKDR